jgi:hypothetical protein
MGLLDGIFGFFDFIIKPLDKICEYALKPVDYLEERPILLLIMFITITGLIFLGIYIYNTFWGDNDANSTSNAEPDNATATTMELYEHNKRIIRSYSYKTML